MNKKVFIYFRKRVGTFFKFLFTSFENVIGKVMPLLFIHWVSRLLAFVIIITSEVVVMIFIHQLIVILFWPIVILLWDFV